MQKESTTPSTPNDPLSTQKCRKLDAASDLWQMSASHIDSFNYFLDEGLEAICRHLAPVEIFSKQVKATVRGAADKPIPFDNIKVWFEDISVGFPTKGLQAARKDLKVYPFESRLTGDSYEAPLLATIARIVDGGPVEKRKINLGSIPLMVKSKNCHLAGLTPAQLVDKNEDCTEVGGYFILNGLDKLLRMIVVPRRNYPFAISRPTFHQRKKNFTQFAVSMKSVREDLFSQTVYMHYSYDGGVYLNVMLRKVEYLLPAVVVLKALADLSDRELYNKLVRGAAGDSFLSERVEVLLADVKKRALHTREQCLAYLGFLLRPMMGVADPSLSAMEVGEVFLREHIMVHCSNNQEKVGALVLMLRKLYGLVGGTLDPDNLDSLVNHEILLGGHLYMNFFREKLDEALQAVRSRIIREVVRGQEIIRTRDFDFIVKALETQTTIGKKLEYLLATGNLKSQSGLDLMQNSGYSIVAEKLNNMRFFSHMRSLHRGAYFTEMKTTKVRKLLPENWGFLCPVHTPDGGLCGLLNHLSYGCRVQCRPITSASYLTDLVGLCTTLGMYPEDSNLQYQLPPSLLPVVADGRLIGHVSLQEAEAFVRTLREAKVRVSDEGIYKETSIALIKPSGLSRNTQMPGVYIYNSLARTLREVTNLELGMSEWLDPLEQSYMAIACNVEDIRDETTHQEIHPDLILSELATQIPFLQHNQSPRNMYQCQMAKQTMGTPYHNHPYRTDKKIYKVTTPQNPIVTCDKFENLGYGEYPSGTNAVIAVISYTGYDIEDAMIINKGSYDRGFQHGAVYKVVEHQLCPDAGSSGARRPPTQQLLYSAPQDALQGGRLPAGIGGDGLPELGTQLSKGTPELVVYENQKAELKKFYFKDSEKAYLEAATLVAREGAAGGADVRLKYRYTRNPVIGDKFSSRHGQKGVLSVLWPSIDMPFSEQGISPDIIINPNAFPSRMTIGMLIEALVGKTGSLDGKVHNVRAFENYKNDDTAGYFGKQLRKHGFNHLGNEVLYSGVYGTPLKVEIFMGVVYYQRLRHMVSDKSQARSTGPIDVLTRQPVKGRKKGGGIRLGEMERDALIAHGVSYCLYDRLVANSDYSEGYVCKGCGSLLSAGASLSQRENKLLPQGQRPEASLQTKASCRVCGDKAKVEFVGVPYVLRYLTNELAAMNIKLTFTLNQGGSFNGLRKEKKKKDIIHRHHYQVVDRGKRREENNNVKK